jgi:hypothetical protein
LARRHRSPTDGRPEEVWIACDRATKARQATDGHNLTRLMSQGGESNELPRNGPGGH